ncbi:MAG TPA: malectin domain-containing carbohydrate-binding protein, partial [Bryobacteraceae bacterium]|nr:malectin domain-containing carbohydrate-binding protein [Bryobacteraceae bacterium]
MQSKRISLLALACLAACTAAAAQQININCGGAQYTAASGTVWAADEDYNGGDLAYTGDNISNTNDLYLYRSARTGLYGDFSYNIPVANGTYNLSLLFAEVQYWNPGDRVFNVLVNGAAVLTNFDIVAQVGPRAALMKTFPVTVTSGAIQIAVNGVVRRGILNGIQIAPASGGPTPVPGVLAVPSSLAFTATVAGSNPAAQTIAISNSGSGTLNWTASKTQPWLALSATSGTGAASLSVQPVTTGLAAGTYTDTVTIAAAGANPASQTVAVTLTVAPPASAAPVVSINCGGASFTGTDGTNWSADEYYTGGDLAYTGYLINGTPDLYLYRSARQGLYGDFSYSIPLPNGTYSLKLRFAEILYSAQGQRVFDVAANGAPLLTNFDILSEVAPLTADDKTFPVTVTNGTLQLAFTGVAGRAIVNGIQVFPTTATAAPSLNVTPSALSFTAAAGSSNPTAQNIAIANTGGGTLNWTASKTQSWLSISATSGTGAATLSVQPVSAGLAAGTYTDTVTIAA